MRKTLPLILIIFFISLNGCAFINLQLATSTQPLEEKVLEGEGTAKLLVIDVSGTITEQEKSKKIFLEEESSMVSVIKEELLKAEKDKAVKRDHHQDRFARRDRHGLRPHLLRNHAVQEKDGREGCGLHHGIGHLRRVLCRFGNG